MGRLSRAIGPMILVFLVYIVFTGSLRLYDVVTGIAVAIVVGLLTANIVVEKPGKLLQLSRLLWLIVYALYYFFIAEVRAHLDVIYRILHPRVPVNPAIVRIPYSVESDYAVTAVANSITNTPGTVVVDIDPDKKIYYVHWINAKTLDPLEARKLVSESFERYARKVFD